MRRKVTSWRGGIEPETYRGIVQIAELRRACGQETGWDRNRLWLARSVEMDAGIWLSTEDRNLATQLETV